VTWGGASGAAGGRATSVVVRLHHPVARAFDYLADPRHRPEWQSSLRRVEMLSEQTAGVGTRWRDVTWLGVSPELRVVTHEPQQAWAEEGRWRGITASLLIIFVAQGDETDLEMSVRLRGTGIWRLPAAVAGLLTPAALRSDLARADRILASR
jgi:hypothetical protein